MTKTIDLSQLTAVAQWIEKHAADLPQLMTDLEAIRAAQNLADFWAALKTAGDLVLPWLEDCPLVAVTDGTLTSSATGMAAAINVAPIIQLLPQLIGLIQAIVAVFHQTAGGQALAG